MGAEAGWFCGVWPSVRLTSRNALPYSNALLYGNALREVNRTDGQTPQNQPASAPISKVPPARTRNTGSRHPLPLPEPFGADYPIARKSQDQQKWASSRDHNEVGTPIVLYVTRNRRRRRTIGVGPTLGRFAEWSSRFPKNRRVIHWHPALRRLISVPTR